MERSQSERMVRFLARKVVRALGKEVAMSGFKSLIGLPVITGAKLFYAQHSAGRSPDG